MTERGNPTATVVFARPNRTPVPPVVTADVAVAPPPRLPRQTRGAALARLLPMVVAGAMIPIVAVAYRTGAATARNPIFMLFPLMMLVSMIVTVLTGWNRRHGAELDADRDDYLDYLSGLREAITETTTAQHRSLNWCHSRPDALWTLAGGPRMWERRRGDADFGRIRIGVGPVQPATRVVGPQTDRAARVDPVTDTALRRFVHTHATIPDAPVTIALFGLTALTLDGEATRVRELVRAIICQVAMLHGPDLVSIVALVDESNRERWDWLKWLPHHQHPLAADAVGPARMVYPSLATGHSALTGLPHDRHLVVVVDGGAVDGSDRLPTGVTVVRIGGDGAGPTAESALTLRVAGAAVTACRPDGEAVLGRADRLDETDALVCARRLAGYRIDTGAGGQRHWADLIGIDDVCRFDPAVRWAGRAPADRLRIPVGSTDGGKTVLLDIKEAAENGMGPHGLCIGATGSGKSELLRTIALGMMVHHSPEVLNLVLVDFKGGATFLGMAGAAHVAAVITNLADEAPLVARLHDALSGELNRRQELLRSAGNFDSLAGYEQARRSGAPLAPLPALFVIVDEFSELLSQHPDFVDVFVAIGRLGRSLGIHLLLASQRLDEGRLRGLDAHLSYRVCLKTLSANESRMVLGVPDAYQLPNTPGLGYLRSPAGEVTRFQAALVSGPCPDTEPAPAGAHQPATAQLFAAAPCGQVTSAEPAPGGAADARTVLQTVLDRLIGHGPPARRVWLPPLDASPTLDSLLGAECDADRGGGSGELVVPIGIVDRPFDQRHDPMLVDLRGAAGHVAIVGAPQSGKSTALATLVTALAATHPPDRVQFYGLDFGGGTLTSLRGLPQVGSVATRSEPEVIRRTISEMESVIATREALFREHAVSSMEHYRRLRAERDRFRAADRFGDVFLLIDGWAGLCQQFDTLETQITALASRGLSFGVHLVLSASRWAEIRPGLRDQIGTRIELRLGDPADSELGRKQAHRVPPDKPGRGLTSDGLHMLIALPRLDSAAQPGELLRRRYGDAAAPPVPLLPTLVHRHALNGPAGDRRPLLGIEEHGLQAVTLDFGRQPHLLILGDNECGKTSVLRLLCAELTRTCTAAQAELVLVDYRRGLLGAVRSDRLAGYAVSAGALSALLPGLLDRLAARMPGPDVTRQQLANRTWWSGPDIYLLVDDYDLVAAVAGNPLTALLDYLPHATDLGLHLVVARRSGGAARAVYEPVLAALRDLGAMGLMLSGSPDEGPLIGSVRPVSLPPGRGTLVTRAGGEQLVQVAWIPPP